MTDVDTSRETTVSGVEAARRANVTYRQLDYYLRSGLLVPSGGVAAMPGEGFHRALTPRDVDALRVLGHLMFLRGGPSNRGLLDRYAEIVKHVQVSGFVGTFELIPGITVDLERLVEDNAAVDA